MLLAAALTLTLAAQTTSPTPLTPQALHARVASSIVAVYAPSSKVAAGSFGLGAGVVLHKDGWIVTAAHVVDENDGAYVVPRGAKPDAGLRARVISLSRTEDIALLKLDEPLPKGVVTATLGDSDALKVGDFIGCIGTPFNLRDTFTTGIVSALRDDYGDEYSLGPKRVIQTDAAINQGSSGGALFNAYGEVVGITSSIRTTGHGSGNVGVGFAVPSSTVRKRLFDQPLPAIGVMLRRIPEPVGRALHWDVPGGALLVEHVIPDSPAAKAGLRGGFVPSNLAGYEAVLGGDIIVKVGPHPTNEGDKIAEYLRKLKAGDTLSYTIVRESHKGQVDIVMPDLPKPPVLPAPPKRR